MRWPARCRRRRASASFLDGALEAFSDETALASDRVSFAGNDEPWVVGANQPRSCDGVANKLRNYFEGETDEFAIYDRVDGFIF
ncbi:MAG: hypothetical protein AAF360_02515 [Pseudomonadota bacterium]